MKPKPEKSVVNIIFPAEGKNDDSKNMVSFYSAYDEPGIIQNNCEMDIYGLTSDGNVFFGVQIFDASGYTPGGTIELHTREVTDGIGTERPPTETEFDILWHKLRDLRAAAIATFNEIRCL